MNTKQRAKFIGAIGTLLIHGILILFLIWVTFIVPDIGDEESGVPILMGEAEYAIGGEKVDHFIDVEVLPEELTVEPLKAIEEIKPEMITQDLEETVSIPAVKEKKTNLEKSPEELLAQEKQKKERLEKERLDALKKEQARIERERKEKEEAARKLVASSFGKGAQMDGSDTRTQKVKDGVSTTPSTAVSDGNQSGYGILDLKGRSAGKGGIPRPVYNGQEEGVVVVEITVNPDGRVINPRIINATKDGKHKTSTMDIRLRKSAEDAASKTQFNAIQGVDNQVGTITYYFNLK